MSNIIDYTKMKKSKKKKIVVCPQCGKKGKLVIFEHYYEGQASVQHKKEFKGFYWNITESCYFKNWKETENGKIK